MYIFRKESESGRFPLLVLFISPQYPRAKLKETYLGFLVTFMPWRELCVNTVILLNSPLMWYQTGCSPSGLETYKLVLNSVFRTVTHFHSQYPEWRVMPPACDLKFCSLLHTFIRFPIVCCKLCMKMQCFVLLYCLGSYWLRLYFEMLFLIACVSSYSIMTMLNQQWPRTYLTARLLPLLLRNTTASLFAITSSVHAVFMTQAVSSSLMGSRKITA